MASSLDGLYCGPAPVPDALWTRWNLDPWLLVMLAVLALVFARNGRGLAAVGVLAIAFVSPLCALSSALFAARVAHHVLLVAVAAPLLALAWPARRGGGSLPLAFAVSTAILWFWHAPPAYDRALAHMGLYWVMQFTLLLSALWFWRAVFAPRPPVEGILFIVAGFAQMGMLGALLTFAPGPLYAAHMTAPFDWGLTPLGDQRLGGLLMWVPAGLPYAVAAGLLARRGWAGLRGAAA